MDVVRGQLSRAEARLNQTEAALNQKLDRAEAKADQNEAALNQKLDRAEAKLEESKVARRSMSRVLTHIALNNGWCAGPGSDAHRRAQAKARAELKQTRADAAETQAELEQARAEARAELERTKSRLDGALRQLDEVGARVEVRRVSTFHSELAP
jgi:DNA repair exonuclease SbcCD ATPase subunit